MLIGSSVKDAWREVSDWHRDPNCCRRLDPPRPFNFSCFSTGQAAAKGNSMGAIASTAEICASVLQPVIGGSMVSAVTLLRAGAMFVTNFLRSVLSCAPDDAPTGLVDIPACRTSGFCNQCIKYVVIGVTCASCKLLSWKYNETSASNCAAT